MCRHAVWPTSVMLRVWTDDSEVVGSIPDHSGNCSHCASLKQYELVKDESAEGW